MQENSIRIDKTHQELMKSLIRIIFLVV